MKKFQDHDLKIQIEELLLDIMVSVAKMTYMQALVKAKQCLCKKKFIYKCANVDTQADTHTSN